MANTRDLDWDGCYNVRDLGGLPLGGGGQTIRGSIIRADLLGRLTPAGKKALRDYGVRTVVDLRGPVESAEEPTAVFPGGSPAVVARPAMPMDPGLRARMDAAKSMAEIYILAVDHNQAETAWGLRAVATSAPGGVVVHCHSGKDRTGILVALLLSLAGVAAEDVAIDYAASQARLWPLYERMAAEAGGEENLLDRRSKPLTPPQTILELLVHVRQVYGGTTAYMSTIGLTGEEIARLRARLVPTTNQLNTEE